MQNPRQILIHFAMEKINTRITFARAFDIGKANTAEKSSILMRNFYIGGKIKYPNNMLRWIKNATMIPNMIVYSYGCFLDAQNHTHTNHLSVHPLLFITFYWLLLMLYFGGVCIWGCWVSYSCFLIPCDQVAYCRSLSIELSSRMTTFNGILNIGYQV